MNRAYRSAGFRLVIAMVLSMVLGLAVSEVSYRMVNGSDNRPQEYDLTIPAGTAERVEAGLAVTTLPSTMRFVEGDTILVKNEDSVSHQLGPIWVPPGATGKLALDRPQSYSVACSFQPGQQLGLEVAPRVNASDRVQAALAFGLPTGVLAWLFSLVALPVKGLSLS